MQNVWNDRHYCESQAKLGLGSKKEVALQHYKSKARLPNFVTLQ